MAFSLPQPVCRALSRLEEAGFSAYVVGGCVRDHVLGIAPHDYDIATAASPEQMQRIFCRERTIETGLQHGTLTVLMDGMPLEITTFRQDGAYLDGRHPASVRFTARVEDDLARRDFTINAMAYSPAAGLIDPFHGQEDCRQGLIRCVGDPATRFSEDALRILRALRFSARLGFPIEENTAQAIHEGKALLDKISRERIAAELDGLLLGSHASAVCAQYRDVLARTLTAEEQRLPLFSPEGWPLVLDRLARTEASLPLRWSALLLDGTPDQARDILMQLKMPHALIGRVGALIQCSAAWREASLEAVPLQERLMVLGPEALRQQLLLARADAAARQPGHAAQIGKETESLLAVLDVLLETNACYTLRQLAVRGDDLAALGFKGQAIGDGLNRLLLRVVRGEVPNEKEALLHTLR